MGQVVPADPHGSSRIRILVVVLAGIGLCVLGLAAYFQYEKIRGAQQRLGSQHTIRFLPSDSWLAASVQVKAFMGTEGTRAAVEQLLALAQESNEILAKFQRESGIDPLRDVEQAVLVLGDGGNQRRPTIAVLATANWNKEGMRTFVSGMIDKSPTKREVCGQSIFRWEDERVEDSLALAFPDSDGNTLLFGHASLVEEILRLWTNQHVLVDGRLQKAIDSVDTRGLAWATMILPAIAQEEAKTELVRSKERGGKPDLEVVLFELLLGFDAFSLSMTAQGRDCSAVLSGYPADGERVTALCEKAAVVRRDLLDELEGEIQRHGARATPDDILARYVVSLLRDAELTVGNNRVDAHFLLRALSQGGTGENSYMGPAQSGEKARLTQEEYSGIAAATTTLKQDLSSQNESAAVTTLRQYLSAQGTYHRTDYDRDGVKEYASDLDDLYDWDGPGGADPLRLVDLATAQADKEVFMTPGSDTADGYGGVSKPRAGYFFADLPNARNRLPATAHTSDTTSGNGKTPRGYTDGFGLIAFPATWGREVRVFIITDEGTVYSRALRNPSGRFDPSILPDGMPGQEDGWTIWGE